MRNWWCFLLVAVLLLWLTVSGARAESRQALAVRHLLPSVVVTVTADASAVTVDRLPHRYLRRAWWPQQANEAELTVTSKRWVPLRGTTTIVRRYQLE